MWPGRRASERLCLGATNSPVFPAVIKQRIASAHHYFFDFSDKNRVVARILRAVQPAFEIRQGAIQYRSAVSGTIKVRSCLALGMAMVLGGARIIFGNDALVLSASTLTPNRFLACR